MEKFYTVFCATDELHTSPAIQMYSRLHDLTLSIGDRQIISFLLPSYIHSFQHEEILVLYEPDMIDINTATLSEQPSGNRLLTNLTLDITPRDIGSSTLGFATPENAAVYSLKRYEPQFIKNKPMS